MALSFLKHWIQIIIMLSYIITMCFACMKLVSFAINYFRKSIEDLNKNESLDGKDSFQSNCVDLSASSIKRKEFLLEKRGYNRSDVKAILIKAASAMESEPKEETLGACVTEIESAVFRTEKMGYDRRQVDQFLDELVERIKESQTGT